VPLRGRALYGFFCDRASAFFSFASAMFASLPSAAWLLFRSTSRRTYESSTIFGRPRAPGGCGSNRAPERKIACGVNQEHGENLRAEVVDTNEDCFAEATVDQQQCELLAPAPLPAIDIHRLLWPTACEPARAGRIRGSIDAERERERESGRRA
jgi:hypothetical protein